jgi:outer membrane protein TolC
VSSPLLSCLRMPLRRGLFHAAPSLIALGFLAFASANADEPQTLSLHDAQRLAVAHSRLLPAQDAAAHAAREQAVAAGQLPDPVLSVGIDSLPINTAERFSLSRDSFTERKIGVMQEFTRSAKLGARTERYTREAEKADAQKQVAIADIQRDTALAWLDCWYAEAMAAALREQIAAARLEIDGAEAAYRANKSSRADVIMAQSGVAELEDRAAGIDQRVRSARALLARWLGDAAALTPLANPPDIDALRIEPQHLDAALADHPGIQVFDKDTQIADADARLAEADKSADWSVELSYAKRGAAYSDFVSLSVSIPWQWNQAQRQDRERDAKVALVEQARARRDEALRQDRGEIKVMLGDWDSGRARHAHYSQALLPLAQARIDAVLTDYGGGKGSLGAVLDARRAAVETRIQALQLEQATARTWAQLSYLIPDLAQSPAMAEIRQYPATVEDRKELP